MPILFALCYVLIVLSSITYLFIGCDSTTWVGANVVVCLFTTVALWFVFLFVDNF